jgi:hypothetical protein
VFEFSREHKKKQTGTVLSTWMSMVLGQMKKIMTSVLHPLQADYFVNSSGILTKIAQMIVV